MRPDIELSNSSSAGEPLAPAENTVPDGFNRLHAYMLRVGLFPSLLILSASSVLLSILITIIVTSLWGNGPDVEAIAIAVIVPISVAPPFSYIYLSLLFKLERARKELHDLANTDELTRAFNRRYFTEAAGRELERANRYHQPLSVILVDIDDFKMINDTYGHPTGDLVLRMVSAICLAAIRMLDIFARYGGEEFIILLPQTDLQNACAAAERIRGSIHALHVPCDGRFIQVTISLGVASLVSPSESLDSLIQTADQALYRAKRAGKNQISM